MGENETEVKESLELRAFALCGFRGIGKTETAIVYAYRRRDMFGAVFSVRSESHHALAEDFIQIAEHLGIEHYRYDSVLNLNLIQTWLGEPLWRRKRRISLNLRRYTGFSFSMVPMTAMHFLITDL